MSGYVGLESRLIANFGIQVLKGQSDVVLMHIRCRTSVWSLSSENSDKFRAVVIPCQEVEDGVQTAVHAGKWTSDFVSKVDDIKGLAICV